MEAARDIAASKPYQVLVKVGLVAYGLVHLVLAWLAVRLALGVGGGDAEASNTGALQALAFTPGAKQGDASEQAAQGLLNLPFGQALVALVGAGVTGYGVYQVSKAVRKSFNDDLHTRLTGTPERLAQAGFVGKGVAYGVLGLLFVWAALSEDASRAGGLDQAMHVILAQPFGQVLLLVVALGIAAYGVYCFFWARHAKHA